jgi:hypothetical protein
MANRFIAFALLVIISGIFSGQAHAQSRTVFSGIPVVRISEGGVERFPENIPRDKAVNLGCVISEIDGRYYWANRENTEMTRKVSGAFVTYVAINGSGYVRVIDKSVKAAASLMSPTEVEFDYVEHMMLGLRSITYYGNSR